MPLFLCHFATIRHSNAPAPSLRYLIFIPRCGAEIFIPRWLKAFRFENGNENRQEIRIIPARAASHYKSRISAEIVTLKRAEKTLARGKAADIARLLPALCKTRRGRHSGEMHPSLLHDKNIRSRVLMAQLIRQISLRDLDTVPSASLLFASTRAKGGTAERLPQFMFCVVTHPGSAPKIRRIRHVMRLYTKKNLHAKSPVAARVIHSVRDCSRRGRVFPHDVAFYDGSTCGGLTFGKRGLVYTCNSRAGLSIVPRRKPNVNRRCVNSESRRKISAGS